MTKTLSKLLAIAVLSVIFAGTLRAEDAQKRELRSVWFTTVWGIDWPSTKGVSESDQQKQKTQFLNYLEELEAMNITSICFQVRSMSDAMYKSAYCPWSSYLTGERGADPGWDPLEFAVEECHKRGIECWAWLNPYRWSSAGYQWNSTEHDIQMQEEGWLLSHDNQYITLNPALEKCQQRIVDVCKEVVVNYKVDGILFDDYFYPNNIVENSNAADWQLYQESGSTLSIGDWRRANVNKMVERVYKMIQENRPDVRFGISPAGVSTKSASKFGLPEPRTYGVTAGDWQYSQIYSDPVAWLAEGTIDFISPQCYWKTTHSSAPYEPLCHWWSDAANTFGRHYYSSHSVSYLADDKSTENLQEMANQVAFNRQYTRNNAPGAVFYSTKNVTSALDDHLKAGIFAYPSLHPVITWKEAPNLGKVSNLTYSNGTLVWDAVSHGNAIVRYTVYAVPHEVSYDDAMRADGDGLKVEYLQKVWYQNNFTLADDKKDSFWYAVCVYDGYGNEYEPAIVNYPEGESAKVTLTSPVNGVVADWEQTFAWSELAGATFRLQISDSQAFENLIYNESQISTNNIVLDLYKLEDAKTYYWRVYSREASKLETVSDVATFKAPTRQPGKAAVLIAPEDGAIMEDNFTFSWTPSGDVDVLQVSKTSDFAEIKYSAEVSKSDAETSSVDMISSILGKGKFYWRVVSKFNHALDAVSDVRSFEITKISVGNFETGYSIKTDIDTYNKVGNVQFESLWMRSINEAYNNVPFEKGVTFNRGFCAVGDYVYISGRSENSSSTNIYLRKMDGQTGEVIEDIALSDNGKVSYFPCNDVIKDSNDNICITNLTLDASTTPLKVFMVNLETGELTEVASLTGASKMRIDHVALYGDVKAGNFCIFAPKSSGAFVTRYTFKDGKLDATTDCQLAGFYPDGSNVGIAPRVVPVDENKFFLDGGATAFTLYDFNTGKVLDSFANNDALAPVGMYANGGVTFAIGNTDYVAYSCDDPSGDFGHRFNLVTTDANYGFAAMNLLWTFPKQGIGAYDSTTVQADVDYVSTSDKGGILYLYVPGNGVAAYKITDTAAGGVDALISSDLVMTVAGKTLRFSEMVESVEVYSPAGALVARAQGVDVLSLDLATGAYVVLAKAEGNYVKKVVIIK